MAERKTSLPVITVPTSGMSLYDKGIESALLALLKTCAVPERRETSETEAMETVGILGFTPMDFDLEKDMADLKKLLEKEGGKPLFYGMEGGLEAVKKAPGVSKNLVVSPAGLAAAKYLEKEYGTAYETGWPEDLCRAAAKVSASGKSGKILIVHQQVRANALRDQLRREAGTVDAGFGEGSRARNLSIRTASWFMMLPELMEEGDLQLREEEDFRRHVLREDYDLIIADPVLEELVPEYEGAWVDAVHFAVSGQAPGGKA